MNLFHNSSEALISLCVDCGKPIDPIYIGGQWRTPLCHCKSIEKRQAEIETYEKQRVKNAAQNTLGVNPKIMGCSFDNFIPRPGVTKALEYARVYSDNIAESTNKGAGILFVGDVGTGKSHLSAAIASTALRNGYTVVYEVITELLSKIRSSYGSDYINHREATELDMLNILGSCDLLVLDDLGTEKATNWSESIIYTIINKRYSLQKPIITSTNLSLRELEGRLGRRTMDRLIEMCKIKELSGESYRKIIARERMKDE